MNSCFQRANEPEKRAHRVPEYLYEVPSVYIREDRARLQVGAFPGPGGRLSEYTRKTRPDAKLYDNSP